MEIENKKGNIGVFDSGLGGLWILKHIKKFSPEYNYVFYGDQKNVPYGIKSKEELLAYTKEALTFLYENENCIAVLLACNTTSTAIYSELKDWVKENYPDRLLFGIAHPTVESVKHSKSVMVFATHRTVDSHFYQQALEEKNIKTYEFVLLELASMIERGEDVSAYLDHHRYIIPEDVDSVILGCTHYGIVLHVFREIFPQITHWLVQEKITPPFLKEYIDRHPQLENRISKDGELRIFVSGKNPVFEKYLKDWYGEGVKIEYI